METRFWIVICPEPHVKGGLWKTLYAEKCVAVGWGPSDYPLEGPSESPGWSFTRARLKEMKPGHKVIPFLLGWRIGPVGTITALDISDGDWKPTVAAGDYALNPSEPDLGRRVRVEWDTDGMPPAGQVATVPARFRSPKSPLARHTIEELSKDRFEQLRQVLGDPDNWANLVPVVPPTDASLSIPSVEPVLSFLERDLQKFLARNLHLIEPGLKATPDYQLEEHVTEVGRIDLFCFDAKGRYVVVELKAGVAGDDAIGQILGYMAWVRENVQGGETARGIIVCRDATERLKAASKLIPDLRIKKYDIAFTLSDLA
jgi:hypothetical protein